MRRFANKFIDIKNKGGFEQEWIQFRHNLSIHKYKIMLLSGAICFPLYKPFVIYQWSILEDYLAERTAEKLKKHQPVSKITESFLKQTVMDVLMDEQVRRGGQDFAQDLIAQRVIIDAVVKMLLAVLQDPVFLKDIQVLGTTLGKDIVTDPDVQRDVVKLLVKVFQDEEIIFESSELIKKVIQHPDVTTELILLLKKTFMDPDAKDAITTMLNESFNKILFDPVTIDKVRIFSYNLMKAEIKGQDKNKSSLFDLMIKKAISRNNSDTVKKSEIEDILFSADVKVVKNVENIVSEKVDELEQSVVVTKTVDNAVSKLEQEVVQIQKDIVLSGKKIDLEQLELVDKADLDSRVQNLAFNGDFILIGGEVVPSKNLSVDGSKVLDF